MGLITEIKGFSILPIRIYSTVHSKEILHYIFFKKHDVKLKNSKQNNYNERSLFVINFPKDITLKKVRNIITNQISDNSAIIEEIVLSDDLNSQEINLNQLTNEFNDVNNQEYHSNNLQEDQENQQNIKLPRNSCIIRFIDKSALNLFFKNYKKIIKLYEINNDNNCLPLYPTSEDEDNNEFYGYKRYLNKLKNQILNTNDLLININISISKFNKKEIDDLEEMNQEENLIDEDGFQLVVSKSHRRTKKTIMGKVSKLKLNNNSELKNKFDKIKRKKQKDDFYRFQIREKKKIEMNSLLKKFKEDQEEVKLLKERRSFNPY